MRLPNPYSLVETLEKLRHGLAAASNQGAQALMEKAVAKAHDDEAYARQFEETLLQGSTVEIRECLSCFGDCFERSRDAPPYYPHHDAVNGIDCALYAILFALAHPEAEPASPPNPDHLNQYHDPDIPTSPTRPPHYRWPFAFQGVTLCLLS